MDQPPGSLAPGMEEQMTRTHIVTNNITWFLLLMLVLPLTSCRTTRSQQDAVETAEPPDETGSDTPGDPQGPKPKPKPPDKPF